MGFVTGLEAEARIARRLGPAEAGGGLPAGAEAAAERLVAQGARALVSFGLAGGLDPAQAAGALMVPVAVEDGGTRYLVDQALAARFAPPAGLALAAATVLASAAEKRAAHIATGAVMVDLESGAVARVAARHALPFAILRAISDPAGAALPPAAQVALDDRGRIRPGRVLAALLRRPGQLAALLALARDADRARATLRDAVARLHGQAFP